MTTITHATGVITPTIQDGYSASLPLRTIVHEILGRPDDDVTFRPAGLRTGTLPLVFASHADAWAAVAVLARPEVFTLTDTDVPEIGMSFVVADGELELQLDPETRVVWLIQVPFREVLV